MKKTSHPILRVIRGINDGAVVLLFVAMTITVLVQVFFRFVIQSPLRWTEELSRYLMIWLVLLASGVAMRNSSHLQVDVLTSMLPDKPKRILTGVVDVLTIIFLGIMTFYGIQVVGTTVAQTSPAMQVPMAFIYLAFPVGGVLMIMEKLLLLIAMLTGRDKQLEEQREGEG